MAHYAKMVTLSSVFEKQSGTTKYLEQGLSPLHSRVMSLFDSLKENHHHCAMDNLYNWAKFCKALYNHNERILCYEVIRKGKQGLPNTVIQNEVKNPKDIHKV